MKITFEKKDSISGQWVPTSIEVDPNKFAIDEEKLIREACEVPQLMLELGTAHAEIKSALARKEEQLKRVSAVLALDFRKKGVKPNDAVKEEVITTKEYQQLEEDCANLSESAMKIEAYWRTAQQKCELIKMLGYRQNAEIKRG